MKTFTLIAALLFAPAVYAQTKTTDTTSNPPTTTGAPVGGSSTATANTAKPGKLSKSELQVVAHYHELNKMEVDLGNLAIKRGKSDAVKDYGRMLVKDHGDSNKKLSALAKKRKQTIPAEKPANEVEKQDKADAKKQAASLKKLKGTEFDTAFLAAMVQGHDKELAKVDAKIAEVQDAELADMLKAKKPVLQHHADHAREVQKTMGNAQASATGSPTTTPATGSPGSTTQGAGTVTSGSTSTTTSGTSPTTTTGSTANQARRPNQ
jgi:putative membrane protein